MKNLLLHLCLLFATLNVFAKEEKLPDSVEAYALQTSIINNVKSPYVTSFSVDKGEKFDNYTVFLKGKQDFRNPHTGNLENVTVCSQLKLRHSINDNIFVDFGTVDCI